MANISYPKSVLTRFRDNEAAIAAMSNDDLHDVYMKALQIMTLAEEELIARAETSKETIHLLHADVVYAAGRARYDHESAARELIENQEELDALIENHHTKNVRWAEISRLVGVPDDVLEQEYKTEGKPSVRIRLHKGVKLT